MTASAQWTDEMRRAARERGRQYWARAREAAAQAAQAERGAKKEAAAAPLAAAPTPSHPPLLSRRSEEGSSSVPAPLFAALAGWPAIMERLRWRAPELLPLRYAGEIAAAHQAFEDIPWPRFSAEGATQAIPDTLLATLRAWLPWLLRARTTLIGMSYNEQVGITAAQSWFETHPNGV